MPNRRFERPPPRRDERQSKPHFTDDETTGALSRIEDIRAGHHHPSLIGDVALRYTEGGRKVVGSLMLDWDAIIATDKAGMYYIGTKQVADEL